MDNLQATSYLCTAICSAFYPEQRAVEIALFNAEINATQEATPKDKNLLKVAVSLVLGYVETSRSEGGISVGVNRDAIEKSIKRFASDFGVDLEDLIECKTVENASFLW